MVEAFASKSTCCRLTDRNGVRRYTDLTLLMVAVKNTVDQERLASEKLAAARKKRDAQAAANTAEWRKILPNFDAQ